MSALMPSLAARVAGLAPLVLRVFLGLLMFAHGYQKLTSGGPAGFGRMLAGLGVPAPIFAGYVVTFAELIGGALLVVGLLSRLASLVLIIELVVAIALVKVKVGLIAGPGGGAGAELDLVFIAGFVAILLGGPGGASLDRLIGIEKGARGAGGAPATA